MVTKIARLAKSSILLQEVKVNIFEMVGRISRLTENKARTNRVKRQGWDTKK